MSATPNEQKQVLDPLVSDFAGDEEMMELVEMFVSELPLRVQSLREALDDGNTEQIKTISHQLKGSAGGYGFDVISQTAKVVEQEVMAGEAEVSALSEKVEALIQLMNRATA